MSFSGCGYRGTIKLPLPERANTITIDAIHTDTTVLTDVEIMEFLKKYPHLTCMSNEDFDKMGKELINRRSKLDICYDIINNNNKESKSWWEF